MYPYNYLTDDGSINLILLAPLVIASFIAKKLPREIRNFLWKNYWWICSFSLVFIGNNYTDNFSLLAIFGGIGALSGLIGATGFNPKDFADEHNSELKKPNEGNFIEPDIHQNSNNQSRSLITSEKIDISKDGEQLPLINEPTSNLSSSALAIVKAQRKIYDDGIWKK